MLIFKPLSNFKNSIALLTLIPNNVFEELKQIQETFSWGDRRAKIEHDIYVFHDGYDGSLKSVDMR